VLWAAVAAVHLYPTLAYVLLHERHQEVLKDKGRALQVGGKGTLLTSNFHRQAYGM